jgi:hypothetical protein
MAIHSLTIDRFSALHCQIDRSRRMTSHRSGTLRERLCIVSPVTED